MALAVGFQPLPGYRSVEFGYLWDRYKKGLPDVTEQAPIEMPIERFGRSSPLPEVSFQILETPPAPRLWFSNASETELVQVQSNWFARNWRKRPTGTTYPRYPTLRSRFAKDLRTFLVHITERGIGEFRPTQCEVSYINHIPLELGASFGRILRMVSGRSPGILSSPEGMRIAARYVFGDPPLGRLHVSADSGTRRSDNKPIMVLTLTARGAPRGEGIDGVLEFLDIGHLEAVRAFDSLTTDAMHTAWGKNTGEDR